jgi:hypothetical protein
MFSLSYHNTCFWWFLTESALLYRVYHLKCSPTTITRYGIKLKSDARTLSPNLFRNTRVVVILAARPLLKPEAQNLCRCEYGVYASKNITSYFICYCS